MPLRSLLTTARKNFSPPEYKKFFRTLKTLETEKKIQRESIIHLESLFRIFPEFDTIFTALFSHSIDISPEEAEKHLNKKQQALHKKYQESIEFDDFEKNKRSYLLHFLFTAFIDDVRVIYFFLARQWVIAQGHKDMDPDRKIREGKRLMDIVAPLAHRMGIHSLKEDFETLGFQILFSEDFTTLSLESKEYTKNKQKFFKKTAKNLEKIFKAKKLSPDLQQRTKNIYSIFKKMQLKGKSKISEINDIFAIRVITETKEDCYKIFGLLHSAYRHVPGKIKDYISLPKANAYQSLHTIIMIPFEDDFIPLEVQIRTYRMHAIAEEGVASHLLYKEDGETIHIEQGKKQVKKKLQAIRSHFSEETFLMSASKDLFANRIFVFTKDGDIKSFARGATVLDFAYALHSDIGEHCTGGIINQRDVDNASPLRHLDSIEVLTSETVQVREKWTTYCSTPLALRCIRAYLRRQEEEDQKKQ